MRIVDTIPHERFKIQIFSYNSKYTVKIELGQFEQSYKIGELDVMGVADVKAMITPEFLSNCLKRLDRKSTRLNSSHVRISYAVFCLKKKTHRNVYVEHWIKFMKDG